MELNKIHNIDCLEFMKTLPDKCIDLVLTDPPYGINYDNEYNSRPNEKKWQKMENDDKQINYKNCIEELQRIGKKVIIFGAENFYKDLPHRGRWICWDKRLSENADKIMGSSFELAWVDSESGFYKTYRVLHGGVINDDSRIGNTDARFHPTQKPVRLMQKIIQDYSRENDVVFDPFLGSGTTAVAAKLLNRNYIGCEISPEYCKIAEARIKAISNPLF